MTGSQFLFLLILVVLGAAVLASYITGIKNKKDVEILWGGLSEKLRKVYTFSILLSTVAFLVVTTYITIQMNTESYPFFFIAYPVMLIASATWLPLVNRFVKTQSDASWYLMRLSLAMTGIASFTIFFFLLNLSTGTVFYYIALGFSLILAIHTFVLDGIVWPTQWRKK